MPARTSLEAGEAYEVIATLDVAAGRLDAVQTIRLTNRAALPPTGSTE